MARDSLTFEKWIGVKILSSLWWEWEEEENLEAFLWSHFRGRQRVIRFFSSGENLFTVKCSDSETSGYFFSCKKGDKKMVSISSRLPPHSPKRLCSDGQLSKSESFRRNVLAASGLPLGRWVMASGWCSDIVWYQIPEFPHSKHYPHTFCQRLREK